MPRSGTKRGAAWDTTRTTALAQYVKLEAPAQYCADPDGDAHDVVLSFGARSLVLMGFDERAVGHWPLASLHGHADGAGLVLRPDQMAQEHLRLDDPAMIEAIRAVCPTLMTERGKTPSRRPMRWVPIVGGLVLLGLIAGIIVLPLFAERIAQAYPMANARALGRGLTETIRDQTPQPLRVCTWAEGVEALNAVIDRVSVDLVPTVMVLDRPSADMLVLPGAMLLLDRGLLERMRTPEAVAALIAYAVVSAEARAPTAQVMAKARSWGIVRLHIGTPTDDDTLRQFLAHLKAPRTPNRQQAALTAAMARLAETGLPANRLARMMEQTANLDLARRHGWGPSAMAQVRAGDTVGDAPYRPALDDRAWLALQNICDTTDSF